jgi:putative SOS response-associated peptidase YedK
MLTFIRAPTRLLPSNKVAGALHDRMPVVLAPDGWSRWLGEQGTTPDELKALLVPCPDEALKIWPVDRAKIGSVRNKEREVADPVEVPA